MPLPRYLAHLKWEISEKKWVEARRWAGGRVSTKEYRLPREQRPDKTVAGCSKRLASRFYQLNCLTGHYLEWTRSQPTAKCWRCPCRTQTRDHVLKICLRWKLQKKILWAEVRKESGRGKDRFKIRGVLAVTRCSQPVLDCLYTTVGRRVPPG
jgi:hypothetical protein